MLEPLLPLFSVLSHVLMYMRDGFFILVIMMISFTSCNEICCKTTYFVRDFVFGQDNIGIFVDQDGKLLHDDRICWSDAPLSVVLHQPYVLACLPRHVEVYVSVYGSFMHLYLPSSIPPSLPPLPRITKVFLWIKMGICLRWLEMLTYASSPFFAASSD